MIDLHATRRLTKTGQIGFRSAGGKTCGLHCEEWSPGVGLEEKGLLVPGSSPAHRVLSMYIVWIVCRAPVGDCTLQSSGILSSGCQYDNCDSAGATWSTGQSIGKRSNKSLLEDSLWNRGDTKQGTVRPAV